MAGEGVGGLVEGLFAAAVEGDGGGGGRRQGGGEVVLHGLEDELAGVGGVVLEVV